MNRLSLEYDGCSYFEAATRRAAIVYDFTEVNLAAIKVRKRLLRRSSSDIICNYRERLVSPLLKDLSFVLTKVVMPESGARRFSFCWDIY